MNKKDHSNNPNDKDEASEVRHDEDDSNILKDIVEDNSMDICDNSQYFDKNEVSSSIMFTRRKQRRTSDIDNLEIQRPKKTQIKRMDKRKEPKSSYHYKTSESTEFIKLTLEGFKSSDEMQILTTLNDLCSHLSIANDSVGQDGNYNELIKQLIVLLDKFPMIPDISMMALNCINYLLDINPRATNTVIKSNGVDKIVKMAQNVEYIDSVESAIKAIEKMSYENPFVLIEKDSFFAVLAFIDFFDLNLRKLALKACVNMVKTGNNIEYVKKHILQAVPNLTHLTKLSGNTDIEKIVVDLSVQCFYYILIGIKNYNYSIDHNEFCNTIIQYGLLENLFDIFTRFISLDDEDGDQDNNNHSNIIISQPKSFTINVDTVKTILKLFEALCLMSGDITNIILNNNTLEMIYKVLNREIGSGLSDTNKKKLTSNSHSMYHELFGLLAALFPPKKEKNELNRILLDTNKFYFIYFSDKILTLLIDNILHIPSSSSMIGVIKIIFMYCSNTPKEYIIKYINEKKLSNIISKNLDSKDSNYILKVLNLVELIMSRVPEQFVIAFIRDGVHGNIKNLITIEETNLYIPKDSMISYIANKRLSSGGSDSNLIIKQKHLSDGDIGEDSQTKLKMISNNPKTISPSVIVDTIHSKAKQIIDQYFSDKDIQQLVLKTNSKINPIAIMNQLIDYKNMIKDNKCTSLILKDIISLMVEEQVTFYEIEKSEIVLYLCHYIDSNFFLNYTNAYDNDKESNVILSNDYNKNIISKLTELCNTFDRSTCKIENFLKLLQQCISSMNCFKLYLVEFSGIKNLSQIFASSISRSHQEKSQKMSFKLYYERNDKILTNLTDKSLQKMIHYFEVNSPVKLSIESNEKIEALKDKLMALPMENSNNIDNLMEREDDLYNVFNKFFKNEKADEDDDEIEREDHMLEESENVFRFLQELKSINKEKLEQNKQKEEQTTESQNQINNTINNEPKDEPIPKGKNQSSLLLTEDEIDEIQKDYDIHFHIKLSNGLKHPVDSSSSFSEFMQKAKSELIKPDLLSFVSSLTLYFDFIDNTQKLNNSSNDLQIEPNSQIIKSKIEPLSLRYLCSLNESNFIEGKLQSILFEKCYYDSIVNNKALYNIKRASPFFYLISTIELISSSFGSMFDISDKILNSHFENLKMTSLLFKQVKDPYAISSSSIPSWCQEVNMSFPFFTGFSSRYLLFKVASFDIKRSMTNLYVYLRNFLGENLLEDKSVGSLTSSIKRAKVKIHRDQILKNTTDLMNDYSNYQGYLEFEYFNETGTGMGPTLEYYSLVLKEIINIKSLWYPTEDYSLFPIPSEGLDKNELLNRKKMFECLGFVIARGIFDDRLLDIPLNSFFWDLLLGRPVNINHISLIDKNVGSFLLQLQKLSIQRENSPNHPLLLNGKSIEYCDMFFTLPTNNMPLKEDGNNIQLNSDNINEYIWLMFKKLIIEGQEEWIESFKQGFNRVFPITRLKCFSSNEIEEIICGSEATEDSWTNDNLIQNIIPMHGYNKDSMIYQGLITMMTQMDKLERKLFLLFVTGAPRLPIGGFKNLHPKLTVVMYQSENKMLDESPDSHLPSVMTCQNYLKIPNYSSFDVLKNKIAIAIKEGSNAFHLS